MGNSASLSALVAEDHYLIALDVETALKRLGFAEVVIVASNAQALLRLEREAFDLAVVDVGLSDGRCDPLVAALADRGTPFIYLSGYDGEFVAHVPAPWIAKPMDEQEFAHAVRDVTAL